MNVAKHSKIELLKDCEVVFTVFHRPACVSLAIRDGAVVEGDVNVIWLRWLNPVVSIENREDIEGQTSVDLKLTSVLQEDKILTPKCLNNRCDSILTICVFQVTVVVS